MSLAPANAANVSAAVPGVFSEVAAVIAKLAHVSSNFAVVALSDVLADLALVRRNIMAVGADFARVLANITALDASSIVISAPLRTMCKGALCTG